jgi:hypothetical protein
LRFAGRHSGTKSNITWEFHRFELSERSFALGPDNNLGTSLKNSGQIQVFGHGET